MWGDIYIVPAGNLNESFSDSAFDENRVHYLEGLSKLNLGNTQAVIDGFVQLFKQLQQGVACDAILIDSRTGFNDIFGTAVLHLSTCVVGFFGFSRQTAPGFMHLLSKHSKDVNRFALMLAYSIIPDGMGENDIPSEMKKFIQQSYDEKSIPPIFFIHRNSDLETIGTGDDAVEKKFVDDQFLDYNCLFGELDSLYFPKEEEGIYGKTTRRGTKYHAEFLVSKNSRPLTLRNIILQHLKIVLSHIANFAEDTVIDEQYFFYRECMKKIFKKENFIIQGYKGTGKTFLYRALKNRDISRKLQEWSGVSGENEYNFINVLAVSDEEPSFPFKNISYSKIEDPEYYFNSFWQIYTWNKLLYDDGNPELKDIRETIKNRSELGHEILPIDGQSTKIRFNRLVDDENTLLYIENDLKAFNEELQKKKIVIVALYDRLDSCINPLHWNKAVSPLIDYWRQNYSTYSNIYPN